jgi:hypothetical protein
VFYDKKQHPARRVQPRQVLLPQRSLPDRFSLDNFTNAGLTFSGTLVSAGIFPDIKEPLGLQPDYALGFVRPTGEAGMPLYGKKAKFTSTLRSTAAACKGRATCSTSPPASSKFSSSSA